MISKRHIPLLACAGVLTLALSCMQYSRLPPAASARDFLLHGESEEPGYGLYSYLLFGSRPNESTRPRYLAAIEAYLGEIEHVNQMLEYFDRGQLNITYLPVDAQPSSNSERDPEWFLDHYDYPRARALLAAIPGDQQDGPYIISSLSPLGTGPVGQHLYQDLSAVPPHLVHLWIKEFLGRVEQEQFWEERTAEQLVLDLRTSVGQLAEGLENAKGAMATWIKLVKETAIGE